MISADMYSRYLFYRRKKLKDKIIIIESDDWGLERASSAETLEWMRRKFGSDKFSRWSLDSIETAEDMIYLFDLLENYRSKFQFPPVITANFITHNFDYSENSSLCFRSINSQKGDNSEVAERKKLYKTAVERNYIFPQLHGYSHYNITEAGKYFETEEGREAFDRKFLAARSTIKSNLSFLQGEMSIKNGGHIRLKEASDEFAKFFGFRSVSFIPPTFIFEKSMLRTVSDCSIRLIQSANRLTDSSKTKHRFPYFNKGKGFFWSVRNARLDPHPEYKFYHEQCLKSIEAAFKYKIPAVIDFHRVNIAGSFNPAYRDTTLTELKKLLDGIYKNWPDVKFMHTAELNNLIWQREIR